MKRTTTLFLIAFVLLLAIHPVVLFHFCSGSINSVQILSEQETTQCCEKESSSDRASSLSQIENKCCHTSVLELSTDDYLQHHTNQRAELLKSFDFIFLYASVLLSETTNADILSSKHRLSPEIVYETGRELLTRICIYRI